MLTAIGDVMRRAYDKGWITTRDGNISLRRRNSDILYITPSGWRKSIIHPEHIIRIKLNDDGELDIPASVTPSGELEMHRLLQIENTATRAVVHLHPTHVVAALFAGWDLQRLAVSFPEVSRYTRVGPSVAVLPATSKELAEGTYNAMTDLMGNRIYDVVGQSAHGVCAVGKDPWAAYEHIERLDHICEIVLKSGVRPEQRPATT
jgi:ribulose-5-phosphate 4-epimerase/fuculose-1-phosphate aldolase